MVSRLLLPITSFLLSLSASSGKNCLAKNLKKMAIGTQAIQFLSYLRAVLTFLSFFLVLKNLPRCKQQGVENWKTLQEMYDFLENAKSEGWTGFLRPFRQDKKTLRQQKLLKHA